MPLNGADECTKIEVAFRKTMSIYGENTARVLLFQLEEKYDIRIGSTPCASLEEIEAALFDIAGVGADILISRMRSFMR
jgi:hypothetical protein